MSYTQQQRKERVRKYFIKTPDKPKYLFFTILTFIALIVLLKGWIDGGGTGILMMLAGIAGLVILLKKLYEAERQYRREYKRAEPKATDKEMDEWLRKAYDIVALEARRRLDIDDDDVSAHPLMIDGPATNYNGFTIGPGKDRVLRYNKHNILLLFLTDHNIAAYKCIFDLEIGEILEDSTKEFPYKDITNLETHTTTGLFYYNKDSEKTGVEGVQTLSLYTSGSNNISVNYFFSRNVSDEYIYPPSDAENTIRAVRKRLKEYKDRYSSSMP